MVGVCVIAALLRKLELMHAYRVSLAAAIVVLAVTGHLGGSITHGRDFLTRNGPRRSPGKPSLDQPVFAAVIEPILQQRCVACHGPEKHKADLRLDTLEALLKGGQNGPVIKTGQPEESPLLQRILLPADHDGHMPPEDQPQATPQEIALLNWWINAGAPGNQKIADLRPAPKIWDLLEVVSRRTE